MPFIICLIDIADLETKHAIRCNLKMVMSTMDLDTATSKQIQEAINHCMPGIELTKYRKYIDNEVKGEFVIGLNIFFYKN